VAPPHYLKAFLTAAHGSLDTTSLKLLWPQHSAPWTTLFYFCTLNNTKNYNPYYSNIEVDILMEAGKETITVAV
jgi:hypothetical protein